jgi:hypothetical protein
MVYFVLVEIAMERCLQGKTVKNLEFSVKSNPGCAVFRFFILKSATVVAKHLGLFGKKLWDYSALQILI